MISVEARRTELPESTHVGKHLFDVHPNDPLCDFLDSVDDLHH